MGQNGEPKWQKEIEELLLKAEQSSAKVDERKPSILADIGNRGRSIKELRNAWGDLLEKQKPQNYLQSYHLLKRHYDIWRKACQRVIHRYQRTAHMLELGAPSIIMDNEKRMLSEASRYLSAITALFSLNVGFEVYKPSKRHWKKYNKWIGTHLKIQNASHDDTMRFFITAGFHGKIAIRKTNDTYNIIFYFPKGKEPKGWKGKVVQYG